MHIRKLVKSGYSSMVIAVPKEWLEKNKLKAGNLIYVEEDNNKLIISPELKRKTAKTDEKIINVDGKTLRIIQRDIHSAYLDNYSYIVIKGKELKKIAKSVKKMISGLVALEVVEDSSEKIIAKSFLDIYDIDIKILIRRMDNIIRSMIIDTYTVFEDKTIVDMLMDRDEELNRLSYLLYKILKVSNNDKSIANALGITDMDLLRYWELNGHMEKIGDRIKQIASLLPKLKPSYKTKFINLFSKIEEIYKDAIISFHNLSLELSDTVSSKRWILNDILEEYIKTSNSPIFSEIMVNAFNMLTHINDIGRIVRYAV